MTSNTVGDRVAEIAEKSHGTVYRVEEVSPAGAWTLSETENVDSRLAVVEVAEAEEVLGAARFIGGISYITELKI